MTYSFKVHAEGKQSVNVFKKPAPQPNVDSAVLATLRTVPTLGEVKARQLLAKFKSKTFPLQEQLLVAVSGDFSKSIGIPYARSKFCFDYLYTNIFMVKSRYFIFFMHDKLLFQGFQYT